MPSSSRAVRRSLERERGSAAVEFALVLPLLLIVTLGLVQVGLLARDQLLVVQASRAGAREAAINPDSSAARNAAVRSAGGLDGSRMVVTVSVGSALGEPVTVAVSYEAPVSVPLLEWLFPPSVSLSTSVTDRREYA